MAEAAAKCENCGCELDPKEAMNWYRKKYMDGDRDPLADDDKFLCPTCYTALPQDDRPIWISASQLA